MKRRPIRAGRQFGFINRAGTDVATPQYAAVEEAAEDRVRVTKGTLSGYIGAKI